MPLHLRSPHQLLDDVAPATRTMLAAAVRLAQQQQARLWLVGGVVRDLLLNQPLGRDVDLAVEGDALALAEALAHTCQGRLVASHAPFGTATVEIRAGQPAPLLLDLAMARRETYPHPAALPIVAPASISEDLGRRDFSFNALALELHANGTALRQGQLLDPFGGRDDLVNGVLRVLHGASFRDDPTRILRGVRLAARLDLRLDGATAAQLHEALASGYLAATTPERVCNELCLALDEPSPAAVLALSDRWELSPHLWPGLAWQPRMQQAEARLAALPALPFALQRPLIGAGVLSYGLTMAARGQLATHYRLPTEFVRLFDDLGRTQALLPQLEQPMANSALDQLLRPLNPTALLVVACTEPAPLLLHYLTALRPQAPILNG
nr:CCA tRNA nucleotidyltransferase [Chloroflexaceae bacterium]